MMAQLLLLLWVSCQPRCAYVWRQLSFLVVLVLAFSSLSHGTQDLYPTFLTTNTPGSKMDSYDR